jgi:O-antigen ligase
VAEQCAFWLFVATLAWAPFPLGSNRPWSWSLLALLVACCWTLWCGSIWRRPERAAFLLDGLRGPLILAALAIAWAIVQVTPIVPSNWLNPVWHGTASITGEKTASTISISPWRSTTELMKLVSYILAAWLARVFAQSRGGAYRLLDAIIIIGALYAAYGFVLALIGQSQFELFYGVAMQQTVHEFPGPFVNRNNFATFEGLVAISAGSRLVARLWSRIEATQGMQARILGVLHYLAGKGAVWLVAALLAFSAVVMTGSRAGNLATWFAALALLFVGFGLASRQKRKGLALSLISCVIAVGLGLLSVNGATLAGRLNDMAGTTDTTRLLLWDAAFKMVQHAPLTGWGLGTYQLVYPLYATASMHFFMDKAHNDFLEFMAGFGLPAAILWWGLLVWLVLLCALGIFVRRRHRVLPAIALGASILVGIHSIFDFSLQMPAIALLYAAILGIGVAQAFPATGNLAGVNSAGESA